MRIAVLVSGGGTNLQALMDAENKDMLGGGTLSVVVSSAHTAFALVRAKAAGIPCEVLERKSYSDAALFDEHLAETLTYYKADLVVLAGFLCVLGPETLSAFKDKILNVHPSLIPAFCGKGFYGLKVHEAALEAGVRVTGATVHFVNSVVDGGRIVLQKAVDVLPDDTAETLQRRVMEQAEWALLPRAVAMYCKGEL